MSCNIVEGSTLDCREGMAGVEELYLTEYTNLNQTSGITASSGIITAMSLNSGKKFWTFQLVKEDAEFKEDIVPSRENGTSFAKQTITFSIFKMSAKNRNILRTLYQNRLLAIVKMYDNAANPVYFLAGQVRGLDVTTIPGGSGKASGDKNGYTVTLEGMEPLPANVFNSASIVTAML